MTRHLRYFAGVRTLKDARRLYRELARRLHPDTPDGHAEWFKEMAEEYEAVTQALRSRRGEIRHLQPGRKEEPHVENAPKERQQPSADVRRADVRHALEELADAAGHVLSALLKRTI
ncbi:MAG TPA: hypothetical protein VHI13_11810 [Candidatus Kapabacteria bacterium]|nr:hypothetical protein [Candidatus Kapabacteria bacterium]